MLVELQKEHYNRVKGFITEVDIQIICLGVMNQDIKGQIWVDDISNPKTCILIDNMWVIYLLGDPNNMTFNQQAGELIQTSIIPNVREDKDLDQNWILVIFSDIWISKIENEMGLSNWFQVNIWHYKLQKLRYSQWRDFVPQGYKLEIINEEFLSKTYLINHADVTSWIYKRWKNPADFFQRGFCFCLVDNDKEIASFAISDWATENYILLGPSTNPKYQKQGFASLVCAAAVEYCHAQRKDVRWFCSSQNVGSWKTAEKVGFQKIKEQIIIVGEM